MISVNARWWAMLAAVAVLAENRSAVLGCAGGAVSNDLPDCPWCGCDTLEIEWTEMGARFCACSCCSMRCRVEHGGQVHKVESRKSDVSGNELTGP